MDTYTTPRQRKFRASDSSMENGYGMDTEEGYERDRTISMETVDFTESRGNSDDVSNGNSRQRMTSQLPKGIFSPTIALPILVFVDMFAVALVVPLLFQYYKLAGVTSATQRELLSSVFSVSQIGGGLLLGGLTDARILTRKTLLFMSFGGSAISYLMITYGGFTALILSRVLVGMVKQTMTVSTSMLSQCTTEDNRAKYMGRLESSMTAAWILGPSAGGMLFKYVDHKAPALAASCLFILDMVFAAVLIKGSEEKTYMDPNETKGSGGKPTKRFLDNLNSCFSSPTLAAVIACLLIFSWANGTTSYSNMGSYYEDMYRVEPHARGYIQSYQRVLGFVIQSLLIGPLLERIGGERPAVVAASALLAIATFWEAQRSIHLFLLALSPAIAISTTMMHLSLRSLLTQIAPPDAIFSIFAALDVLQNATAVTVPFYRTFLFRLLGGNKNTGATMEGDPDPVSWVFSSGVHWVVATVVMAYLLREDGKARIFSGTRSNHMKAV